MEWALHRCSITARFVLLYFILSSNSYQTYGAVRNSAPLGCLLSIYSQRLRKAYLVGYYLRWEDFGGGYSIDLLYLNKRLQIEVEVMGDWTASINPTSRREFPDTNALNAIGVNGKIHRRWVDCRYIALLDLSDTHMPVFSSPSRTLVWWLTLRSFIFWISLPARWGEE